MTTYQDPPLQSRRAARQSERSDALQPQYPDAQSTPPQEPGVAPLTSLTTPESLLYTTQARPVPDYDAQNFRGRRVAEEATDAGPRSDAGYRVRDFSPEARRTALQNWSQPVPVDGNLTYQTQQRPPAPVTPPPPTDWSAQAPVEPVPAAAPVENVAPQAANLAEAPQVETPQFEGSADGSVPEHTLTRRELRALRESQGLPVETAVGTVVPAAAALTVPPLVEPAPWTPAEQLAEPTYVAPTTSQPEYVAPTTSQPEYAEPTTSQPVYAETITTASHYADPVAPFEVTVEDERSAFEALFGGQPVHSAPPEAEFPTQFAPDPLPSATVPPAYVAAAAAAAAAATAAAAEPPTTTGERPVGHWSRQAELDDEHQVGSSSISREVGIGVVTTNALVLPEIPHHDFTRTVTSTGDILVTGSINLPSSLSSTGALPTQYDESDIDHLLDPGDRQVASTDSQPVRAVKAVSTHTSSRGIINAAPPKRGNKMLTALIISASAMLLVVVGLAVVIVMSDVLK